LFLALAVVPSARADSFTDLIRNRDLAGLRALMETDPGAANRGIIDVRREYGDRYRTAQIPPAFYVLSNNLSRDDANMTFRREALALLIENGADVNEPVKVSYGEGTVTETFRPIHYALTAREVGVLAGAGANANAMSHLGDAPLHELSRQVISRQYDYDDATNDRIRALLGAGADPSLANSRGETPLQLAVAALYRARRADHPDAREIADNEERVEILRTALLERAVRQQQEIRDRTGSGRGASGSEGGETNQRRDAAPAPSSDDAGALDEVTDDETAVNPGR
jgi:hypothetical protein